MKCCIGAEPYTRKVGLIEIFEEYLEKLLEMWRIYDKIEIDGELPKWLKGAVC